MRSSRRCLVIVAVWRIIAVAVRSLFHYWLRVRSVMAEERAYAHARNCRGKTLDGDISVDMQI